MRKEILVLLLCCSCFSLSAQYDNLLHRTFAERSLSLDSICPGWGIWSNVDSSIKHYSIINTYAKDHADKQLAMQSELLLSIALIAKACKNNTPEYIKLSNDLIKQLDAIRKSEKYIYPYILMTLARVYENDNLLTEAFGLKLKAYEVFSNYTLEEFPYVAEFTGSIGSSHYKFQDYHSCMKYMKRVWEYREFTNNHLSAMNTYALCYRNLRMWDSAEHYFNVLYNEAVKHNSIEWQLIAKLNLGHTYYRSQKTDQAYRFMKEAHEIAQSNQLIYGIVESNATLARIAYDSNQYKRAKEIALATTQIHKDKDWIFHYHVDAQRLYEVLAKVWEHEGNYHKAYIYLDSLLMLVDSTSTNRRINLSNAIHKKNELFTEKYLQEKENATLAIQKHRQLLIISIIIVSLILVISILLINRQRLKHKKAEAERQAAEARLTAAEKELASYTRSLQEKKKLIEQFSEQIEEYKAATTEQAQHEILLQLQQSTILTDDDWVEFRNLFEQVHSGFLRKLKEKVPELTPGETRFIVLCKLNLSTKEMAGILGVGDSTIRKYRHQVRNKLGLPEDGDIKETVDII